jgi:ribosome maturation factor RimP
MGAGDRIRNELSTLAGKICSPLGLEVVEVVLHRSSKRWHVRIDIDRPGPEGVGLEDCQKVSRSLEAILDESDPIDHSYTLEVSSPGADRPIRTPDDVRRNTGRMVTVETSGERDDPRSVTGILLGVEDGRMKIRHEKEEEKVIEIDLVDVARARQYMPF